MQHNDLLWSGTSLVAIPHFGNLSMNESPKTTLTCNAIGPYEEKNNAAKGTNRMSLGTHYINLLRALITDSSQRACMNPLEARVPGRRGPPMSGSRRRPSSQDASCQPKNKAARDDLFRGRPRCSDQLHTRLACSFPQLPCCRARFAAARSRRLQKPSKDSQGKRSMGRKCSSMRFWILS